MFGFKIVRKSTVDVAPVTYAKEDPTPKIEQLMAEAKEQAQKERELREFREKERVAALPPYSGCKAVCVKCGHDWAHSKCKRETVAYSWGCPILSNTIYLERTCTSCGYTWQERCLDSK